MALDNNSQTPVYKSDLDWGHQEGLTQNHLGLQEVKGHQIFRFTHICLELWARQSRFSKGEEFLSFEGIGTKWKILREEERSPWSSHMCHWDVAAVACVSSLLVPAGLCLAQCRVQQGPLLLQSLWECVSTSAFIFCSNLSRLTALASYFGASVQINCSEIHPKDLSSLCGQSWIFWVFFFPHPSLSSLKK